MGYDLHITRASEWSQSSSQPITPEEWLGVVQGRSDYVSVPHAEATSPSGELIRVRGEHMVEWRGHPSGAIVWFSWFRGRISVKNPDDVTIDQMRAIATALGARVQGDEGEHYDAPPAPQQEPPASAGGVLKMFRKRNG